MQQLCDPVQNTSAAAPVIAPQGWSRRHAAWSKILLFLPAAGLCLPMVSQEPVACAGTHVDKKTPKHELPFLDSNESCCLQLHNISASAETRPGT